MLIPLLHSLIVATTATAIAFVLMLPLAFLGAFHDYHGKLVVELLLLLPLVLPPTIVGLYTLQLFGKYGPLGLIGNHLIFSLSGAVLATTIVILPLIYQGLKAAFVSVPTELLDDARLYSGRSRDILFAVAIPSAWPMVLASLILAFARALGEFGASLMVAGYIPGKTDTLSNAIYFAVQNGQTSQALTLSALNIILGILLLLLIFLLNKKRRFA